MKLGRLEEIFEMKVDDDVKDILTWWRTKEGKYIQYRDLSDEHLEAIATGFFIDNRDFGLKSIDGSKLAAKTAVENELYRRTLKKIITENNLSQEYALLNLSKFSFLRKIFK